MKEKLYRAYDSKGEEVKGTIQGEDEGEILRSLKAKDLHLVELSSSNQLPWYRFDLQSLFKKVSLDELISLTRQFYTLFKAGLSIEIILTTLQKQTQNPNLKDALNLIQQDVQGGMSLAKAFDKHPKIFGKLYISMLLAGEEAGILEQVLLELTQVLEKESHIRHEITSATLYPKIVIGVMMIAFYVLVTFIIPKFANFYEKFNATLPLPTRILIGIGNFAQHYWYVVLLSIATVFVISFRYLRTPAGRLNKDRFKLKFPVFGELFQKIAMSRFAHIFCGLYRSGFPLVRSLEVLQEVIDNEVYALEISRIREGVYKGKSIAQMMRGSSYFSPLMVETTAIGEKSGNLDEMLTFLASHYDIEIKHMTKNLTTLLEPLLLIFIFGGITLMALGIFLPIWNLSNAVIKH